MAKVSQTPAPQRRKLDLKRDKSKNDKKKNEKGKDKRSARGKNDAQKYQEQQDEQQQAPVGQKNRSKYLRTLGMVRK